MFDDVEELDAVGPWEVLAHWTRKHPQDGWAVSCLSFDGEPVTAAKGLVLGAHVALDDAPPITSAGVSAGIDMALHLVARLAGSDRARQVRQGIQYDPQPPI